MKIQFTFRHIDEGSHATLEALVRRYVEHELEPVLKPFNPEHRSLHVTVEKAAKGAEKYHVTYRLTLPPKKVLVARAANLDAEQTVHKATLELRRQVKRHREKVSGQENWKRKERRKRLRELKAEVGALPVDRQAEARSAVEALLPRLEDFIRHELTYLQTQGDLPPDYPTVADVRDEAVARVMKAWDAPADPEPLYRRLLKAAIDILCKEVEQTRLTEDFASLEGTPEPDAFEVAESMGTAENGFWAPEEVLHIEDLIPDTEAETPEEAAEAELRARVYQELANLPILWRRVVLLVHREGIPPEAVARDILDMPVAEVQAVLDHARAYLAARLADLGLDTAGRPALETAFRAPQQQASGD